MIFRGRAFHAEERAVQMPWECAWHVPRTAWRSVWLKQNKGGRRRQGQGSKRGARPCKALLAIGRALAFTLSEMRIYHRMPSSEEQ